MEDMEPDLCSLLWFSFRDELELLWVMLVVESLFVEKLRPLSLEDRVWGGRECW